jgi:hypothetical protein
MACENGGAKMQGLHKISVHSFAQSASSFASCTTSTPHIPRELGIGLYLISLDLNLHSEADVPTHVAQPF